MWAIKCCVTFCDIVIVYANINWFIFSVVVGLPPQRGFLKLILKHAAFISRSYFLNFLITIKWKCYCSVVSNSLQPHGLWPARLLCPWNFPGKNTGVGCHSLLQGIFPTQGSNPGLLHYRQILYYPSHQGSPKYSYSLFKCDLLTDANLRTAYCWSAMRWYQSQEYLFGSFYIKHVDIVAVFMYDNFYINYLQKYPSATGSIFLKNKLVVCHRSQSNALWSLNTAVQHRFWSSWKKWISFPVFAFVPL